MAILSAISTETEPDSEKKTRLEIAGQKRGEARGEHERLFMHEPAQHDMGKLCKPARDGGADMRIVIAVDRGPPGGDAVDENTPVGERETHAFARHHRERRRRRLHLGIGKPDVGEALRVPARLLGHAQG